MKWVVDDAVDEQELTGGNTTVVVRIGDTVHRAAGPWTPTIQRLRVRDLAYLAYRLAPLSGDAFAGAVYDVGHLDPMARLDVLTSAYGMPYARAEVLEAMVDKLRDLADWSEARADDGGPAELREHAVMYRADAARIEGLAGADL